MVFEIGVLGFLLVVVLLGVCTSSFALRFLLGVLIFIIIILLFRLDRGTVYCWEAGFGVNIDCRQFFLAVGVLNS